MMQPGRRTASVALAVATLLVGLAVSARVAALGQLEDVFQQGNAAYFREEYGAAARAYRLLLEAGVDDPDVHFNLATTYARGEHYGHAILHFERALRLDPGDEGSAKGLAAARSILGKRRAEAEGEALVETRPPMSEALVRPFTEGFLAWTILLLNGLLFALLLARRGAQRDAVRLGLGIAAPLTAVLLLLAFGGLAIKAQAFRDGDAAIVLDGAELREGPDPRAPERGHVWEGERARLLERYEGFVRVRLPDGRAGWLRAGEAEAI